MEREIASVAAACAMRGFRYLAFPPIVFDAPVVAIDEVVVTGSPLTARLPDGSFALAWVRSAASGLTLRIATIGPGGALGTAADLATATSFTDLRVTPMPGGLAFVWTDGTGGTTIANVACQPPTSRPDR